MPPITTPERYDKIIETLDYLGKIIAEDNPNDWYKFLMIQFVKVMIQQIRGDR